MQNWFPTMHIAMIGVKLNKEQNLFSLGAVDFSESQMLSPRTVRKGKICQNSSSQHENATC